MKIKPSKQDMSGSSKTLKMSQYQRKTVDEGRGSGSGKLVIDNQDFLKDLWGGSPSTTAIPNSCSTVEDEEDYSFGKTERRITTRTMKIMKIQMQVNLKNQ